MKKEAEGVLFLLPYSGWSELHSSEGISVFWFDSSLLVAAAPYVNIRVIVTYDDSITALRRRHSLSEGRDEDIPQMTRVRPADGKILALEPAIQDILKTVAAYHSPLCWLTSCEQRSLKNSAYCAEHTKQFLKEHDA